MTIPPIDVPLKPGAPASEADGIVRDRSRAERCKKIKSMGFTAPRHIKMYGEQFEIVSDPFTEGDGIAVHAISGNDAKIRTVRLPIAILVGSEDRFLKRRNVTRKLTS